MAENLEQIDLQLDNSNEARELFGNSDNYLKRIEEELQVSIITRGEQIQVSGKQVKLVEMVLTSLLNIIKKGLSITERDVLYAIKLAKQGKINQFETLFEDEITKNAKGKSIRVKTLGQKSYVNAIRRHDLVFGIGPAGTGKTYLAVVTAVDALKNGRAKRIILTQIGRAHV